MNAIDPQKIREGFWLIRGTTYVKAEKAELVNSKGTDLILKNLTILTLSEQKAAGVVYRGSHRIRVQETKQ